MSNDLDSKTKEELIDIINEKNDEIEELQQDLEGKNDDIESLECEIRDLEGESVDIVDLELISKSSFDSGYLSGVKGDSQLKAWLNHKIGARI